MTESGRLAAKRADYFAAGTQVVWVVDVLREGLVRVYQARVSEPCVYRRGERAEAEPALPGWTIAVDDSSSTDRPPGLPLPPGLC